MLIRESDIRDIESAIEMVVRNLGLLIDGQDSFLEFSYKVGKLASGKDADKYLRMPVDALRKEVAHILLSGTDDALLEGIREDLRRRLPAFQEDILRKIRLLIQFYEDNWRDRLLRATPEGKLRKSLLDEEVLSKGVFDEWRAMLLKKFWASMRTIVNSFKGTFQNLARVQLWTALQHGQTSNWDRTDMVWKKPRVTACPVCLQLHLNPDGSPKLYRLSKVRGVSNVGKKPRDWEFVLGPTHPNSIARGQRVRVPEGYRRIEDIVSGDMVLTRKGWAKVVMSWLAAHKEVIKVTTRRGYSIVLTEDHLLMSAESDCWLEAKYLLGSRVSLILPGQKFMVPGSEEILDPCLLYLMGFYLASGDMSKDGKEITLYWRSDDSRTPEVIELSGLRGSWGEGSWTTREIGDLRGVKTSLPKQLFQTSSQMKQWFLEGLRKGLGNLVLKSYSSQLMMELQLLLQECGVSSRRYWEECNIVLDIYWFKTVDSSSALVTVQDIVEKVERLGTSDVFDLMVEGAEEFQCQGLLVHNCYCVLHNTRHDPPVTDRALANARRQALEAEKAKRLERKRKLGAGLPVRGAGTEDDVDRELQVIDRELGKLEKSMAVAFYKMEVMGRIMM